jgi:hypothetical protein
VLPSFLRLARRTPRQPRRRLFLIGAEPIKIGGQSSDLRPATVAGRRPAAGAGSGAQRRNRIHAEKCAKSKSRERKQLAENRQEMLRYCGLAAGRKEIRPAGTGGTSDTAGAEFPIPQARIKTREADRI